VQLDLLAIALVGVTAQQQLLAEREQDEAARRPVR